MFSFRFVGWLTRWTLATAFFLAVMAFAAYFVFNEAVKGGGYVNVPDIVGLNITKASNELASVGLEIGTQTLVSSDRFPEYHVILQRPAGGKSVRSGRKVSLTVSAGKQFEQAPNLIGKNLNRALQDLQSNKLVAGTRARVANKAPLDVVLAQDPPPGDPILARSEIHLLLSDGPLVKALFMPDLVGKSTEEALEMLGTLGVHVTTYKVDTIHSDYDLVLAQQPPAGTRLIENASVQIDVRPLQFTKLPNVRRRVALVYTVPVVPRPQQVRIQIVDKDGIADTIWPKRGNFVNNAPPLSASGTQLNIGFDFSEEATVEISFDNKLVRSYFYRGDAPPVITEHRTRRGLFNRNPGRKPSGPSGRP